MTLRAFIHVQHLLGTGHVVRAAAIGKALAARGVEVTLASGNSIPPTLETGPLHVIELPACKSPDATFKRLVALDGQDIDDAWKNERVKASIQAFRARSYDLLLTETYPFGRRQLDFELTPMLQAALKSPRPPLIATSIRDILVRKKELWKEEWMAEQALKYYGRILVHSDPDFVQLKDSFPFADRIDHLVRYTGYVDGAARAPSEGQSRDANGDGTDEVIVSCGGGAVAESLLEAALTALGHSALTSKMPWRILIGHDVAEDRFQAYRSRASEGVVVERARRDFADLLKRARLSISQAGYNTVLDILTAGVPAVFVPFAQVNETEQTQRAEALERHGRAIVVPETGLTPERLALAADRALELSRSSHHVMVGGADRSADILISDLKEQSG
ncbi:glycosyltransferase [Rhodobacterales bacterium]|nr:glycosyltransferase [Rhodobacterales bacterium]